MSIPATITPKEEKKLREAIERHVENVCREQGRANPFDQAYAAGVRRGLERETVPAEKS